jgi:uncharacterized protein DUF4157
MKAAQNKTNATTAQPARKSGPFFGKDPRQSFFKPAGQGIQRKLTVGAPNDVYEKEADHMADRVVSGVQRKPIFESKNDPAEGLQRKCAACEKEEKVQKKAAGPARSAAAPSVESGISRSKGSGSSLPSSTRNQMESSFGADFSDVKIHQDSGAKQMNKDLNAQAFTHGKDIYFDSGKYNPGNSAGKHLLAHELTHVVQQTGKGNNKKANPSPSSTAQPSTPVQRSTAGANEPLIQEASVEEMQPATEPGVQTKPTFDGAAGRVKPRIQRADKPKRADPTEELDKGKPVQSHGEITTGRTLVIRNFDLKNYPDTPSPDLPKESVKPRKERKTKQASVWKSKALPKVTESLTQRAKAKKFNEKENLVLNARGKASGKATNRNVANPEKNSEIIGDIPTLANAVVVPFWNKAGKPKIHQIEHIIDWQVIGPDADEWTNNLILLDKDSNRLQGEAVKGQIIKRVEQLQADYKKADLPIVKDKVDDKYLGYYVIKFDGFKFSKDHPKLAGDPSIIRDSELTTGAIFSENVVQLDRVCVPAGYCVIKTAIGGEGYILPLNWDNGTTRGVGSKQPPELISIEQKKLVQDNKVMIDSKKKPLKLKVKKESVGNATGYYKLDNVGHATEIKEALKLRGMSPMEFDPAIEVNPKTGITAKGKVKSDIPILKDADIDVLLSDGGFSVSGSITSDVLNGKLPKPLNVDACTLEFSVGTAEPWYVGGTIDFSINKMGTGSLSASISGDTFAMKGTFTFNDSKYYETASLSFGYTRGLKGGEGKWSGAGEMVFAKGAIPGIKEGSISIGYDNGIFSGKGSVSTSIPKLDKINVAAQFDEHGNFTINGDTSLKGVPGIKDNNHISATLTRDDKGYSLAISGSAEPNLPNIPGLGASLTVNYNNGVFTLQGTAVYQKDKLDGSLTVGVTNAVVDENGAPSKDTADNKLKIFGNGSITLHFLKGVDATLAGAVDPKGEMYIWGNMSVTATPFDPIDINKNIFSFKTSIPLVGIPFASINLDLTSSADFHFHWDPLTIHLEATLDRTNIKEIGKAGGELTASLSSHAEAGFMFKIGAGVSVSIAIIKLGAHINGAVDLGLKAEVGAEAKAHWDMQKGLQLEEAEAHLTGVPSVAFILSGDITADVDLWLTSYNVYEKDMTLAKKELDLSQFAFGVSIPLKINDNGKIEGIDYSKLKLTPELGKDAGQSISDQVLNGDDKKKKEQKEREAREKIRVKVVQKLEAKKADGETNMREYASDLKDDIKDDTPDELAGMVDEVVEEEIQKIEKQKAAEEAARAAAAQAQVPATPLPAAQEPPPPTSTN